jgi:hypothetical protein
MSKIGHLRAALIELLQEHERDGALPTSARFLFYELVQRQVLSKEQTGARRPDQDLHVALTQLRENGDIPWDWIVDETRRLEDFTGYASVKAGVLATLPHIKLDPWSGNAPMILTESRSLAGVLRETVGDYRVRIASTNGQVRGFLHTVIMPALSAGDTIGYLGDWDWSGGQIEANTQRVLEREVGKLDWTRIALTEAQVEDHNLPVITKHDNRHADGRPHEAVETEALSQTVLTDMLREWLASLLSERLERVQERERRQQRQIERLLTGTGGR